MHRFCLVCIHFCSFFFFQITPRPVAGLLRPVVRSQTIRYNTKVRAGKGFTLEELKVAGINRKEARGIGISVDHRRENKSAESLQANVQRLKEYKARLIVFPRNSKKPKTGDSDAAALSKATQLKGRLFAVKQDARKTKARKITKEELAGSAYSVVRHARSEKRYLGIRKKRAEDKKKDEEEKKK